MKELEYILPEKIEGTDQKKVSNPFKGKLIINVPKYKERLDLVRKLGFSANKDGEMTADKDPFSSAAKFSDLASKHLVSMEVTHVVSNTIFREIDDLEYYEDGVNLINQIAKVVINGCRLGKN